MKSLLISSLTFCFITALIFAGCNKSDVIVNNQTAEKISQEGNQNTDGGQAPISSFHIYEYVKVSTEGGEQYNEFRPVAWVSGPTSHTGLNFPQGLTEVFTTPVKARYEGSNLVETVNFKILTSSRWDAYLCNYWTVSSINSWSVFHHEHYFSNFPCIDPNLICGEYPHFCHTAGYETYTEDIELAPSTEYTMNLGMDGIVY